LLDKPIKGTWTGDLTIPTKPKKGPESVTNGKGVANGKHSLDAETLDAGSVGPTKRPRPEDSAESSSAKKPKTAPTDDDVVILDDSRGGAIVIVDD